MPTRFAFDNNVIDELLKPENQARVQALLPCVESGAIEGYSTQELIGEAARIIEPEEKGEDRTERLRLFGAVIGHLTDGRHLRTPEAIVETEIMGNTSPFAPENERVILHRLLAGMAAGRPDRASLLAIAANARDGQKDATDRWKQMTAKTEALAKAATKSERRKWLKTPFAEADAKHWEKWGRISAVRVAQRCGMTDADAEAVGDRVVADPNSFPFSRRFDRVLVLLLWWWWAQRRRVHPGDQNDARQLTLFPALDHFVTRDKNLREWSRIIGDPPGKVLSVEEFLDRKWC